MLITCQDSINWCSTVAEKHIHTFKSGSVWKQELGVCMGIQNKSNFRHSSEIIKVFLYITINSASGGNRICAPHTTWKKSNSRKALSGIISFHTVQKVLLKHILYGKCYGPCCVTRHIASACGTVVCYLKLHSGPTLCCCVQCKESESGVMNGLCDR